MSFAPAADDSSEEPGDERAEKGCDRVLELDPRPAATVDGAGALLAGIRAKEPAMQWFQRTPLMRPGDGMALWGPPEMLSKEIG